MSNLKMKETLKSENVDIPKEHPRRVKKDTSPLNFAP